MQPSETTLPLPVPASPGESAHLCSSPHHIWGDESQATPMMGIRTKPRTCHRWRFEEPRQTDTGSAAEPSLGIEFGGLSVFVGTSAQPMAHSMFDSGYFWLNYSASLSPVLTVTESLWGEGKKKIFLWLQRAPDQNLVMLLFLDGEDLKLKIKTQADMWFLNLLVFSIIPSFLNWNNPEGCCKREKDPCGKYLFIHLLSFTFFVKHWIFLELPTLSVTLIKSIFINEEHQLTQHVQKNTFSPNKTVRDQELSIKNAPSSPPRCEAS